MAKNKAKTKQYDDINVTFRIKVPRNSMSVVAVVDSVALAFEQDISQISVNIYNGGDEYV